MSFSFMMDNPSLFKDLLADIFPTLPRSEFKPVFRQSFPALFLTAGTRAQNWTVIISPCPGSLLVLSEMLQGWEKTHKGFVRKKRPPSFSKATTTSSFLVSPRDVGSLHHKAGLPHIVDRAASACLASLNGEGMPCHPACSPCLLLYPVCELLTLIAPAPRPCSPPSSTLQDGLVFLGIRQREGFLLIVPRSRTRHSGSQKRDFCRRSDGKSLSWLDFLIIVREHSPRSITVACNMARSCMFPG
ncbi:uncharacterized protein [Ciconia boyciana]|uniref:uncharacterized protein isoform X2 n=1 Tax=Ciconia boyciana TaxID=52775 RepID=UPI003B9E8F33